MKLCDLCGTNRIILTNQNQSLCLCLRDNCLQEVFGIWTDNHLLVKSMEAWSTQCVMWGTRGQSRLNRLLHSPGLGVAWLTDLSIDLGNLNSTEFLVNYNVQGLKWGAEICKFVQRPLTSKNDNELCPHPPPHPHPPHLPTPLPVPPKCTMKVVMFHI